MEGFVNSVVYQGRRVKFGRLGYFDVYFSKSYLFLKLKVSMTSLCRHNWCILESLVSLPFLMEEAQNFVCCIILMCFLRKRHSFSN